MTEGGGSRGGFIPVRQGERRKGEERGRGGGKRKHENGAPGNYLSVLVSCGPDGLPGGKEGGEKEKREKKEGERGGKEKGHRFLCIRYGGFRKRRGGGKREREKRKKRKDAERFKYIGLFSGSARGRKGREKGKEKRGRYISLSFTKLQSSGKKEKGGGKKGGGDDIIANSFLFPPTWEGGGGKKKKKGEGGKKTARLSSYIEDVKGGFSLPRGEGGGEKKKRGKKGGRYLFLLSSGCLWGKKGRGKERRRKKKRGKEPRVQNPTPSRSSFDRGKKEEKGRKNGEKGTRSAWVPSILLITTASLHLGGKKGKKKGRWKEKGDSR